jgi:hypothetical protein
MDVLSDLLPGSHRSIRFGCAPEISDALGHFLSHSTRAPGRPTRSRSPRSALYRLHGRPGTVANELALEFRNRREDVPCEAASRCRGVEALVHNHDPDGMLFAKVEELEDIPDGSPETVEFQGVDRSDEVRPNGAAERDEARPICRPARDSFVDILDCPRRGRTETVELLLDGLVLCGDACVDRSASWVTSPARPLGGGPHSECHGDASQNRTASAGLNQASFPTSETEIVMGSRISRDSTGVTTSRYAA